MIKIIYEYETPDYEFYEQDYKEILCKSLLKEIESLKPWPKIVITEFYLNGKSQEEIHKEYGLKISYIKTMIYRAKAKLKKKILTKNLVQLRRYLDEIS